MQNLRELIEARAAELGSKQYLVFGERSYSFANKWTNG